MAPFWAEIRTEEGKPKKVELKPGDSILIRDHAGGLTAVEQPGLLEIVVRQFEVLPSMRLIRDGQSLVSSDSQLAKVFGGWEPGLELIDAKRFNNFGLRDKVIHFGDADGWAGKVWWRDE